MPQLLVIEQWANLRLDKALALARPEYSRAYWKQCILQQMVKLNQQYCVDPDKTVCCGDTIEVEEKTALDTKPLHQSSGKPLNIVHIDEDCLVIDKPKDCVVHPGANCPDQTLMDDLLEAFPELHQVPRAGIVHRLDKDTTGLLVIARSLSAHFHLVKELAERKMSREYESLVWGEMLFSGTVNAPLSRHPIRRDKRAVVMDGKTAITHYRITERFKGLTHVSLQLETGRTHQIRVHMQHRGFPIVGDLLYGRQRQFPQAWPEPVKTILAQQVSQVLHAKRLTFVHPRTQATVSVVSPLPDYFQKLLDTLRKYQKQT